MPYTAAGLIKEGRRDRDRRRRDAHGDQEQHPQPQHSKTQAQIEAAMCAAYGASKVIWFPGIPCQDNTDDHVDATSPFLTARSAAVQIQHPGDTDIWSNDERQQHQILSTATDAERSAIAVTLWVPNWLSTSCDLGVFVY